MHLLALNLQKPSAIITAIYGNFSGQRNHEIVVAKAGSIELYRPDDTGKLISISETPVFSVVRSLLAFRLAGASKDYVVIGSDSGKISIVEYDAQLKDWKSIHCEAFGKTGCRRIVPGQYLAADPKGRALMIAGIEKQKFVYIMNRDSANRLTISSPLEAHKSETILFAMCGVDVGFENPVFAMIELEYKEADEDPTGEAARESEKKLTYYELDLGLNHVVRKWSEAISRTANLLLPVPGGDDGPSGVLICGENWVSYKHQGHSEVRTAIPRRKDLSPEKGVLITCCTFHKQKDLFFFLLQSEYGDVYKVTLVVDPTNKSIVQDVVVTVFDTLPLATSMCITKTGLLFLASEFGNHMLLQFQGIGDNADAVCGHRVSDEVNEQLGDDAMSASTVAEVFIPSPKLKNLAITDDIDSLGAITDILVDDLMNDGSKQIYTLCGRGNRSSLRVLRHGVSVTEMAVSDLPGKPTAVWTVRDDQSSAFDKYIVVSFTGVTLVLSIGDNVEEVTDSGFLSSVPTLDVVLLEDNALLQVHATGIRHIRRGENGEKRIGEWKTPGKKQIEKASTNARQVAISLAGGEVTYFEIDAAGMLVEMKTIDMGQEVACLDVGEVPPGRSRSSFLAVGCWDDTVQIMSLDPNDLLTPRSTMTLRSTPQSVCLVNMETEVTSSAKNPSTGTTSGAVSTQTVIYLNIGLVNGTLHRLAVDNTSGAMSDSRVRFLGPKPVKLFRVMIRGTRGVLALSSRAWLLYNYQGRYFQAPISYDMLEYASNFASEVCPEGIVAIASNTLRVLTVDNLGAMFNQTAFNLRYTPRKMCRVNDTNQLVVIETDHNEFNEEERAMLKQMHQQESSSNSMEIENESRGVTTNGDKVHGEDVGDEGGGEEEGEENVLPIRGPLPPVEGKWASCIRVLDAISGNATELLELSDNEAAFSLCTCRFGHRSEETFIVVGTAKDMTLHPRRVTAGFLHVYRLLDNRLQLLHKTVIEDVPTAICEFNGKLLVGMGKCLRLYDLGKKKLLKKCENKMFPTTIVKLQINGDRIYVGDMAESVHYVKYRIGDNSLVIFADDYTPRYVSSLCVLDYDTVAGADKFGSLWVLELPPKASDELHNPTGSKMLWDQGLLNGAPTKADLKNHYYLGEAITGMMKSSLVIGGKEALIVGTVMGGIYAFVPFTSKEDLNFFQHLEMFMRQEWPNLCQRDHLSYRSYYQPVKDIVDGDLCERYGCIPYNKQKELADDLNRTPAELMKKLEETRNALL